MIRLSGPDLVDYIADSLYTTYTLHKSTVRYRRSPKIRAQIPSIGKCYYIKIYSFHDETMRKISDRIIPGDNEIDLLLNFVTTNFDAIDLRYYREGITRERIQ
jgi:hypothetical protein